MYKKLHSFSFLALFVFLFAQICFADVPQTIQTAQDKILSLIDAGDYKSAESAVDKMAGDFADNPQLPESIWEAAKRYDRVEAYDYSKKRCEQMIEKFPNNDHSNLAALLLARFKVYELIDSGKYEDANTAVNKLIEDFKGNRQLPRRLYEIAYQYEKRGKRTYAMHLRGQMAEGWPNDEYGIRAAFQHKMETYTTLDDNKIAEMQTAIDKLVADSNNHPQLARRLPQIMQNIAEMNYAKVADSNAQQQSVNKLLYLSSELLKKYAVGKTTDSGAYYLLGLYYNKLGEYTKAADAFKNAYQIDPKFKYADYCLFAQGYCYEKLMNNKLISETEAKSLITSNYNKLLTSYPQSKYSSYAIGWLHGNQ
jgi:tetratricopeptide (TPR) repeat protein